MLDRKNISEKIEPYKGIIYFVIILLLSNYFWKFTVLSNEAETEITFFDLDITAPFAYMAHHFTVITKSILNFRGSNVHILEERNVLYYAVEHGVRIVPSCTGIKQAYIFFCIIAFTRGPWKKKLWYIPLGLIAIYLFNIIRLVVIVGLTKNHFECFDFLHEYLFKYLFYGLIFLMWVIWDEKFASKKVNNETKEKEEI